MCYFLSFPSNNPSNNSIKNNWDVSSTNVFFSLFFESLECNFYLYCAGSFFSAITEDAMQELTNQFVWNTNTLFSSAGFTLDCCHGSTNLPSIRQGHSVWQRYCLERWFTLHSLNSQEVIGSVCLQGVCAPTVLIFSFFRCLSDLSREKRHMKVQHNVFLKKQDL